MLRHVICIWHTRHGWVDFFVNLAVWVSVALADGAWLGYGFFAYFTFALLDKTFALRLLLRLRAWLLVFLHGWIALEGNSC